MSEQQPAPNRIVADIDVLAADLFCDGSARKSLDVIRSHSWITLIATAALLDEAQLLIESVASSALAADWRSRITETAHIVEPTASGHPALVAAHTGNAATLLTFNESLQSAQAGASLRAAVSTSIKSPEAFTLLVEPAQLYETLFGDTYPGPDTDPRG